MNTFLEKTLITILSNTQSSKELILVFPSIRATTASSRIISEKIKNPRLDINLLTLSQFLSNISNLTELNGCGLQIMLYESYIALKPNNRLAFREFSTIASTLITDFNDIDQFNAPYVEIFEYLKAIRKLKAWTPSKGIQLVNRKEINFIWNNLTKLYQNFNYTLGQKKLGYQGSIAKAALANLDPIQDESLHQKEIHFIGFNALTGIETQLFKLLIQEGIAYTHWDYEQNILNHISHPYGFYYRKTNKELSYKPKVLDEFPTINWKQKNIRLISAPTNISQIQAATETLNQNEENDYTTAIVLGDEQLLPAFINHLPSISQPVNVTMGYPIESTQSYKLLKSYMEFCLSFKEDKLNVMKLKKICNQPLFIFGLSPFCTKEFPIEHFLSIVNNISRNFLEVSTLKKLIKPYPPDLKSLFANEKEHTTLKQAKHLLMLLNTDKEKENYLEKESINALIKALKTLSNYFNDYSFLEPDSDLLPLFDSLIKGTTISLKGSQETGIQLMGMLETRALSFKNIIVTSVNESIMPEGKVSHSYIPFDVRLQYGLPTYNEKDSIFSYHFYRLLQHAENITLIYNDNEGEAKEQSRFIKQLLHDDFFQSNISLHSIVPDTNVYPSTSNLVIPKNQEILYKIKTWMASGISPSALSLYITSPIQFYKRYILEIEENQGLEATIPKNVIGNILHDTLEKLYSPYKKSILLPEYFDSIQKEMPNQLITSFKNLYDHNISEGYNRFALELMKTALKKFIQWDKDRCSKHEVIILGLEEKILLKKQGTTDISYVIKGKIDRIESIDGHHHIVDYKSGKVEQQDTTISSIQAIQMPKKQKAFQLLCYSLGYMSENNIEHLQASVFPIMNPKTGICVFLIGTRNQQTPVINQELLSDFKDQLLILLKEMTNLNIPFTEERNTI